MLDSGCVLERKYACYGKRGEKTPCLDNEKDIMKKNIMAFQQVSQPLLVDGLKRAIRASYTYV